MKILLPIDGSFYSKNAVQSLAKCASSLCDKSTIILVNVVAPVLEEVNAELTDYNLMGTRFTKVLLHQFYDAESYELFEKARDLLHNVHCKVEEITLVGNPAERIAEVADKMDVDLIVMGSHGRSALRTMIFGSVTEGVISRTKKPILLVRGQPITCKEAPKVGIAIGDCEDACEYNPAIANFIKSHRQFFNKDANFYLIHVFKPKHHGHAHKCSCNCERNEEKLEDFNKIVDPIVPLLNEAGIIPKEVCLQGNPAKEIEKYVADKHIDLLIMGSHGHRRFDMKLLGSTTLKVAETVDVPLLIIHNI